MAELTMPDRALDYRAFNRWIGRQGIRVRWFRATPCICRNQRIGQYSRNCALCSYGYVYREQTLPDWARVYFDEQKKVVDDSQLGLLQVGDIVAWANPRDVRFDRPDSLILMDWALEAREPLQNSGGDVAATVGYAWSFALDACSWYNGSAWVDMTCTHLDPETGDPVPGQATLTTDLDTGVGSISFEDGYGPPAGQNFTIIYRYRPTMFVNGASFTPSRTNAFITDADAGAKGMPVRALMSAVHPDAAGNTTPA